MRACVPVCLSVCARARVSLCVRVCVCVHVRASVCVEPDEPRQYCGKDDKLCEWLSIRYFGKV